MWCIPLVPVLLSALVLSDLSPAVSAAALTNVKRLSPTLSVDVNISTDPSLATVIDGAATYVGTCANSTCSWMGVRYAKPPVGDLRFAPAQTLTATDAVGVINATVPGTVCLQKRLKTLGPSDEDCLFLNIRRPSDISLSTKLPVLVFAHGGGFERGSNLNQSTQAIVQAGAKGNLPTIVVSLNYRLGLFGFLGGSTFDARQKADNTDVVQNAALTDLREALKWVKGHIDAFGGDASRITLWGQSAGSFLAAAQLVGTPNNPPFSSIILESGSIGGVPVDPPSQKDVQFDTVVAAANCSSVVDKIACLRVADAQLLLNVSLAQSELTEDKEHVLRGYYLWGPTLDGGPANGGFYSDRPSVLVSQGAFASVPIIHGDVLDQGTRFARNNSLSDADTIDFIGGIYFDQNSKTLIDTLLQLYPDVPELGSPYRPHSGNYSDRYFPGADNQYKRIASIYGDIRFQSDRRSLLTAIAKQEGSRVFSYTFAQFTPGTPDSRGYQHLSDQAYFFNTAEVNPFGDALARQFLSFATYQTPNHAGDDLPEWPQYTSTNQTMFYYGNSTYGLLEDDYRKEAIDFLNSEDVLKVTGR